MRQLRRFFSRARNFGTSYRGDDRLREEMEEHAALLTEENMRAGMSLDEARRQARIKLGATGTIREDYRAEEGLPFIENALQDTRYALRTLRKSPGFTAAIVLILALGTGANVAIFSLVDAVLMRKLPVADPNGLVRLGDHNDCCVGYGIPDNADYSLFSTDAWEQLRKGAPEFEDLAAMESGSGYQKFIVRREGSRQIAQPVLGEFVSGNYFRTFGLQPAQGRLFADTDDVQGAALTAVMGYEAWKNDYDSDPAVVGSTFSVNTHPVTVIGIAPEGFFGDQLSSTPPDLYLPIQSAPFLANGSFVHDPKANWLDLIGRIKPGVNRTQLQAKVSGILRETLTPLHTFSSEHKEDLLPKVHIVLSSGGAGITAMQEEYESQLHLLMAISGLVLLIACANVANLLLVRGMNRKSEMSVRSALGAMRSRLIRQLLTESVVLALLGGCAGLAVAYGGTRVLLAMAFPGITDLPIHAGPSPTVLAFACALSLLTAILFGIAPAWMTANAEPAEALRTGHRAATGGSTLLQRGLVVIQTALSLVLLIAAGLFAQSLNRLQHSNLKLESKNRYIVHIDPQAAGYLPSQVGALYRNMEQQFHGIPGVLRVGISTYAPMEQRNDGWSVQIQGQPDLHIQASDVKVNAEYFDAVGTHVLLGRGVGPQDTPTSATAAIVNESFVKRLFKSNENPIGHHFGTGPKSAGDYEIVGVVEDTAYTSVRWKDHAMYFLPILQRPASDKTPIDEDSDLYAGTIVLETAHPVSNMEFLTQQTLSNINPYFALVKFQTFDRQIADQFISDRMIARLTLLLGGLALLLAAVGLYGVTASTVSRRTSEIGIRMALGAERMRVIGMVIRGVLGQVLLGMAIGLPCAVVCVRFAEAILYEVRGVDMTIVLTAILPLVVATCIAAIIPARRAASIDPVKALRVD
jgi:macrolide transport system ATP-binding/permease protein